MENKCKCCGTETAPIFNQRSVFIYNDFDLTGQEVDPIWVDYEYDHIGFQELCHTCTVAKQPPYTQDDDLPF